MEEVKLKTENWYWCNNCNCIAYNYTCGCKGTSCNAGGCKLCDPVAKKVKEIIKNGKAPKKLFQRFLRKLRIPYLPDEKLLVRIFREHWYQWWI